jgi:hypothetical protein
VPRCDGVDDLAIGENVTVPMEMGLQIPGRFGYAGADDERELQLVKSFEIGPRQHSGISRHHHRRAGQVVAFQKAGDDRDDGGGFGGIAFEAADFQWEPGAVDKQSDNDLGIDAAFLRVADFTQLIFGFRLEIQRLCRSCCYADVFIVGAGRSGFTV